jgi:hypothetical protein
MDRGLKLRFSFLVSRFSFLAARFWFLVSRFSFLVSRRSFLAARFSSRPEGGPAVCGVGIGFVPAFFVECWLNRLCGGAGVRAGS